MTATADASLAQLAEHALRKRMVMGSIPIGGLSYSFTSGGAGPRAKAARNGATRIPSSSWAKGLGTHNVWTTEPPGARVRNSARA